MLSVLIVNDRPLIRQGLKHILERQYRSVHFGEAKHDDSVTSHLARRKWDLIVLSVGNSHSDFHTLHKIRKHAPAARVLVISPQTEYLYSLRVRQLGAAGYIGSDAVSGEFIRTVRDLLAGKPCFDGLQTTETTGDLLSGLSGLSAREFQVLLALREGKRPTDIAAELNLNIRTVSTYKRRVFNKLQLNSVAELVRYTQHRKKA
jgi:DNA-binding NarL/FixJ family response regulator